jgi:hypothetical protein
MLPFFRLRNQRSTGRGRFAPAVRSNLLGSLGSDIIFREQEIHRRLGVGSPIHKRSISSLILDQARSILGAWSIASDVSTPCIASIGNPGHHGE